jgi:hypothetical protein
LDENIVLGQLEELAESLEIEVRHEPIKKGLEGKYILILNPRATTRDKIQALAKAVNRFDLSQVYLRPGLREFLESFPEQRNPI